MQNTLRVPGTVGKTGRVSIVPLVTVLTAAAIAPQVLPAQVTAPLPFVIGERITYRVSVAKLGNVGHGAMWIEGPVDIRGVSTYLLRFDFSAGKGPIKASDQTSSWLDPERMSAQRYYKREKHMLAHSNEHVDMFPAAKRWASNTGEVGDSPSDAPLDELSFMYFIRTLPLADNATYTFNRHFDVNRSPTSVKVIRRETISTGAGKFQTVLVEMRVKDPRRFKGEGVIRINMTDDSVHLPVRIESAMPVIGTAVMILETFNNPAQRKLAKL
jgi:hypothetical protein